MLVKRTLGLVLTLLMAVPFAGLALAQERAQQPDKAELQQMMARFQQRRMQSIKQSFGCNADEFKILEPRIERILLIQFQQIGGYSPLVSRRGVRGPGAGAPLNTLLPPSELTKARVALQEAVDDKAQPPSVVFQRIKEWRAARDASHEELARAQADLREFLTIRQESQAVLMGLLD
jgi:hypothetical protein